jgi:hypothetical protein
MEALLDRLSSGQIVAVISIIAGAIVAITMICAISKYQIQYLTEDTALRRERQKADIALREMLVERRTAAGEKIDPEELHALAPSEPETGAENLDTELAKRFGALDASADAIEQALRRALATDPARKKVLIGVMDGLIENGAPASAILATVRPLCTVTKAIPVEHAA